ncbi:MAG: hypothetical protein AAGJ10_00010 [Bacteroidota bacterium]
MVESLSKADIVKAVQSLPDDATVEDAMERLLFLSKIQRGLEQVEAGETYSLDEVCTFLHQRRAGRAEEA